MVVGVEAGLENMVAVAKTVGELGVVAKGTAEGGSQVAVDLFGGGRDGFSKETAERKAWVMEGIGGESGKDRSQPVCRVLVVFLARNAQSNTPVNNC